MTTALITGASGFVGANLVEAVTAHGWTARALHRKSSSLKALAGLQYQSAIGDILDPASLQLAMQGVDVVFHVAAVADYWRSSKDKMMAANVDGTRHVLAAAQANGVQRVVFTSSVAALGQPAFGQAIDENAQFNLHPNQFIYGYSKVLAEQVVAEFVANGLEVVTVNPAVVTGPRDVNLGSGSLVLQMHQTGIPICPQGGVCVVDVADVCAAHIAAAERGRVGQRYILGGENLWYRDLLAILANVLGRRPPLLSVPAPLMRWLAALVDVARDRLKLAVPVSGDQLRYTNQTFWFDSSKAQRELGLTLRPYAESAQRTLDWYRDNNYLIKDKG